MGVLCLHKPTSSRCSLLKKTKKEQTGKSPKILLPTTIHLIKITPRTLENNTDSQIYKLKLLMEALDIGDLKTLRGYDRL
jgi:hypothetical protein